MKFVDSIQDVIQIADIESETVERDTRSDELLSEHTIILTGSDCPGEIALAETRQASARNLGFWNVLERIRVMTERVSA